MIAINWQTRTLNKKQFWNCLLNWDCAYRQGTEKTLDHTLNDILCAYERYKKGVKLLKTMTPEQKNKLMEIFNER
jgi:hypothetical protein